MRSLYQNKEVSMDYGLIILWVLTLIAGICWIARDQVCLHKYEEYLRAEHITQEEVEEARKQLNQIRQEFEQTKDVIAKESATAKELEQKNLLLQSENEMLVQVIDVQKGRIDTEIKQISDLRHQQMDRELADAQQEAQEKISEIKANAETRIAEYNQKIADAHDKYFAVLEVLRQNENEDETHKLHISETARTDIEYLLNAVALRLNNPNIIYKLIWSEYIQTPTNELLNNILPAKDCSGIYKITDCENKKCYIGRSTSVRKRLQEHIKSTIGIENIASQRVHEIMREKGLWNFRFELLEECPKDQLGEREKYYIDFFDSQTYGYNQVSGSAYKDKGE